MKLEDIRSSIVELSGSGKRVAPERRRNGIYTSFTLPGLDDMMAVRDTKQRFADFFVPENLTELTWIDIGCNVGATAFEAAKRGARVIGVEYREDRVALCRAISAHYQLDAKFYQDDLNDVLVRIDGFDDPVWIDGMIYDFVWCSSVDEYITDVPRFYRMLRDICGGTLYLESNIQDRSIGPVQTEANLMKAGFTSIEYLGNGHSGGISRRRKLYRAS